MRPVCEHKPACLAVRRDRARHRARDHELGSGSPCEAVAISIETPSVIVLADDVDLGAGVKQGGGVFGSESKALEALRNGMAANR